MSDGVRDRERDELLERHAIFGVDVEQLLRHRRETQPLLHDIHAGIDIRQRDCGSRKYALTLVSDQTANLGSVVLRET